jgi:predicted DNA-binding transcriptional regulator AlpA
MSNTAIHSDERYIPKAELKKRWPVCDMTLWRQVRAKKFPAPIQIGGRNYWLESELQKFFESRPRGWQENAKQTHGIVADRQARKAAAEAQAK